MKILHDARTKSEWKDCSEKTEDIAQLDSIKTHQYLLSKGQADCSIKWVESGKGGHKWPCHIMHKLQKPWVEWAQTRDWQAETQPCNHVNGLTAETHTALCKPWINTTHTWPMLTKTRFDKFELHRTDYSLKRDRQLAVQNHQEGKADKNTKT